MLFNSLEFFIFLPVVYLLYRCTRFQVQNYILLAAGYFFYGWWDVRFLFLIAFSTSIDFWLGLLLDRGKLTRFQKLVPAAFLLFASVVFVSLDFRNPDSVVNTQYTGLTFSAAVAFLAAAAAAYEILTRISDNARRKACILISLTVQIGILCFFKYFNFFADSMQTALHAIGIEAEPILLNVILPVGVSFYTFQSLAYMIDIFRKELKPTDHFGNFALFVSYFPQLQAGPIERAHNLLPRIESPRVITLDQSLRGLHLILLGIFKKVGIADGVAGTVDQIFNNPGTLSWIDVVAGSVLFAVQIYCDFSGYSDIARGVSKLLGIDLMVNFNLPYFSSNPQEFWRRWHISLSTWLRDYLYIPLGGNNGSVARVCTNLMITMVLGGLWHGASWNFVLWGFYQGTLLVIYRLWRAARKAPVAAASLWQKAVFIPIFFVFTCYGWLLFRARSFEQIASMTKILFTDFGNFDFAGGVPRLGALFGISILAVFELLQYYYRDSQYYKRLAFPLRGLAMALMLTVIFLGTSNEPAQFIYFQF